jgi:YVTN family beta-propeller protein
LTNDNLATIGKIVEVARPLLHPALRRLMVSTACAPAGRHLPRRGRGFRRCRRGLTVNPGIVSVIDTASNTVVATVPVGGVIGDPVSVYKNARARRYGFSYPL